MFQKLSTQVAHIYREKRKLLQGEQGLCILFLAILFYSTAKHISGIYLTYVRELNVCILTPINTVPAWYIDPIGSTTNKYNNKEWLLKSVLLSPGQRGSGWSSSSAEWGRPSSGRCPFALRSEFLSIFRSVIKKTDLSVHIFQVYFQFRFSIHQTKMYYCGWKYFCALLQSMWTILAHKWC